MAFGRKKAARDREAGLARALNTFDQSAEGAVGQAGLNALNTRQALLGLGGDQAAAEAALNTYQQSTGFQNRLNQGMQAITNNAAVRGELASGGTLKGLNQFGQEFASNEYQRYLDQLQGVEQTGLQSVRRRNDLASGGILNNAEARAQSRGKLASGILGGAAGLAGRIFG